MEEVNSLDGTAASVRVCKTCMVQYYRLSKCTQCKKIILENINPLLHVVKWILINRRENIIKGKQKSKVQLAPALGGPGSHLVDLRWSQEDQERSLLCVLELVLVGELPGRNQLHKKGVPSAVGFPHCAGSGEGLFFKPQALPTQMCRGWSSNPGPSGYRR